MRLDELATKLGRIDLRQQCTLGSVLAVDFKDMIRKDVKVESVGGRHNESSESKMKALMRLVFYSPMKKTDYCDSFYNEFKDAVELSCCEKICDKVLNSQVPLCKNKRVENTLYRLALKGTAWIEMLSYLRFNEAVRALQEVRGITRYIALSYLMVYHIDAKKKSRWICGNGEVQSALKRIIDTNGESQDSFAVHSFGQHGAQCFLNLQALSKLRKCSLPRAVAVQNALAQRLLSTSTVLPPQRNGAGEPLRVFEKKNKRIN